MSQFIDINLYWTGICEKNIDVIKISSNAYFGIQNLPSHSGIYNIKLI